MTRSATDRLVQARRHALLGQLLLGAACLLHACTGWDRRAPHFHALCDRVAGVLHGA